jgi:hypothetical protein
MAIAMASSPAMNKIPARFIQVTVI